MRHGRFCGRIPTPKSWAWDMDSRRLRNVLQGYLSDQKWINKAVESVKAAIPLRVSMEREWAKSETVREKLHKDWRKNNIKKRYFVSPREKARAKRRAKLFGRAKRKGRS